MNREIVMLEKRIRNLKLFIRNVEMWERDTELNSNNVNYNFELLKSYFIKKILCLEKVLVNKNRQKEKEMLRVLRILFRNISEMNYREYHEK